MKKFLPALAFIFFFSSEKISAQLSATITPANPTCANNNGSATVTPSGGVGYTYKWSNGATTSAINNLAAGTYTVTVYSSGGTVWDTIYSEQFEGAHNWALNTSTGVNGADNNFWEADDDESGLVPGGCGAAGLNNKSLHITSVFNPAGGAAYDAGGLCGILFCPETNMATQSPNINTAGVTNLVLTYDFIGNGQALLDNASSFYSINGGGAFASLDASLKSNNAGCGGQGRWTQRSYNLPGTCNNISNFQIRFNWTNNDDGVGTDPSVAINNVLLRDSLPQPGDSVVETVTLTQPTGPHFVTVALSVVNPACGQNNGSINNMGVAGGTPVYTLAWTVGGAQIGSSNSLTNIGAGTYTFEVTDQNGCTIDTSFTLILSGGGGNVIVSTTKPVFCANDSTQICVTTAHDEYLWNTGDTTQCIYTRLAGNYYVTVTDNPNCTGTSNHLAISVYPLPPVSISVNGDTLHAYNAVTYQWYFNGGELNGATDSVHIAEQSGNYAVEVTDTNGCVATSNNVTVIISGMDELRIADLGLRIFPNPVSDELQVAGGRWQVGEMISVYDISGRILMEQTVTSVKEILKTTTLHSGIYFIRIGNRVQRFIKL